MAATDEMLVSRDRTIYFIDCKQSITGAVDAALEIGSCLRVVVLQNRLLSLWASCMRFVYTTVVAVGEVLNVEGISLVVLFINHILIAVSLRVRESDATVFGVNTMAIEIPQIVKVHGFNAR